MNIVNFNDEHFLKLYYFALLCYSIQFDAVILNLGYTGYNAHTEYKAAVTYL